MGWTHLLDENDNVIGVVGDKAWDAAADFCDEIFETSAALPTEKTLISWCINSMSDINGAPGEFSAIVNAFILKISEIYTLRFGRAPNQVEIKQLIRFVYKVCLDQAKEKTKWVIRI